MGADSSRGGHGDARYAVGIDLGTTHCAVSYLSLGEDRPRGGSQAMLPIAQLTAPGTVEARQLLPSFLYLPAPGELPEGSLRLPWSHTARDAERDDAQVVGELARLQGARVPGRLVSSAKSWLSHAGVDRRAPLLPTHAPEELHKLSPLEVSARYLAHLRQAWEHQLGPGGSGGSGGPGGSSDALASQSIVLTVPASFDAAARELTLEAAAKAGLGSPLLLEEPQAALYAWIEAMGDDFRGALKVGDVLLVVDVGGGTCDLSLIAVGESEGALSLHRLAVGDHILLGGDNMDLLLAHTLAQELAASGKRLDPWQLTALTHGCRQAKEQLFADPALTSAPIAIPGRGSSLIGGTLRVELTREQLDQRLVEGFFPRSGADEAPTSARRGGLTQMGLPYAQDAAITRHLSAFLSRQAASLAASAELPVAVPHGKLVHPTAVLFNGGVFKAAPLRRRLLEVLSGWLAEDGAAAAPKELPGADLDLAVARGAAYYGWVRKGRGVRIRGGTARAYYVGVETPMPAVPGFEPPVRALCVAPFGMEEGTEADIPPQELALVVGEPTRFRFFASSTRRDDRVGSYIDDVAGDEGLEELAPLETMLPAGARAQGELTPVHLQAAVTEVGTLELRCLEQGGDGRWKLELNVRGEQPGGA